MSIFRDFGAASKRNAAPATTGIIVAFIATFLCTWFRLPIVQQLAFDPGIALQRPWMFFSYGFVVGTPIGLLFAGLWLWGIGGAVERDLGSLKYLVVWFGFSALSAICEMVGSSLTHVGGVSWNTAWIPISMVTVMWGTRNPDAPLTLMFILPITGKWLAWLSAALVFFALPPELAPFAAIPCILAYYFAANKIPFMPFSKSDKRYLGGEKKWERYDKSYYEEVQRREKDREERERLRKLFEGSLNDDPDKDR